VTGAAFNALFPHGLGNLAFGREPQANPDLASPEGTQYMADLASNMIVPGTFIGPKGMSNLLGDDVARGLMSGAEAKLAQGVPREEVFRELGVFKGPEGKWRYEIDDSGAKLGTMPTSKSWDSHLRDAEADKYGRRGPQISQMKKKEFNEYMKFRQSAEDEYNTLNRRSRPLTDAISHSELTSAYPDIPGINVEYMPDMGKSGAYMPEFDTIRFGDATNPEGTKGLFLHELQHAAQGREGFAQGGSPQMFERGQMFSPKARDLNEDLSRHLSGGISAQPQELFDSLKYGDPSELSAIAQKHGFNSIDEAISYLKQEDAARTPFGQYQRLAGEAEARAVQDRMNMNMDERRSIFPEYATRNDLIIRGLMSGGR
jgi:hypothetical protein